MKRECKPILLAAAVGALAVGAAGCVMYPETEDFGDAVRHMQAVQQGASDSAGPGQDGMRGQLILKTLREDVAKPAEVKNEIVINVGGQSK